MLKPQSHDFLGGSVIILTKCVEILVIEVLDGDLVVDVVQVGVLHDVLDPLLLGPLVQLVMVGRISKLFCRNCEENLFLEVLDR